MEIIIIGPKIFIDIFHEKRLKNQKHLIKFINNINYYL
jgi:hypothetical protein